jgi:hypothetical protein
VDTNIFQYDFIVKGLLGAIFASITAGLAGTYVVSKRMVFLSGGITHASFGGIGIGYFLGINPVIGAAVFGIMSALGVEYLSVKQKIREDSAIGILWAFGNRHNLHLPYTRIYTESDELSFREHSYSYKCRSDSTGYYVLNPDPVLWYILQDYPVYFI